MSIERSQPRHCRSCAAETQVLLDLGPQPLTNDFPESAKAATRTHPLIVGQCLSCRLVQLLDAAPPSLLRPLRPLEYREPEGHLDDLVSTLLSMPGFQRSGSIRGLTYKDVSTLDRLRKRDCPDVVVLNALRDLGITESTAGLETIQEAFSPAWAELWTARRGRCHALIARHLLEHVHDLHGFLRAARQMLADDGCLIVEVPDSAGPMCDGDFTMLWEEHVSYFTAETLTNTLQRHGFVVERLLVYPYAQENSLVAIARPGPSSSLAKPLSEQTLAASFAAQFGTVGAEWRGLLEELHAHGHNVALFGAGHRAAMFINLFGLSPWMEAVVDEAPDKIGRYVPGTTLQVMPPESLSSRDICVCLLAVSSEFEAQVISRSQSLLTPAGRFISIFPRSSCSLAAHRAALKQGIKA